MARPSKLQNAGIAQRKPENGVAQDCVNQPSFLTADEYQNDAGSLLSFIHTSSIGSLANLRSEYSSTHCSSRSSLLAGQPTKIRIIAATARAPRRLSSYDNSA